MTVRVRDYVVMVLIAATAMVLMSFVLQASASRTADVVSGINDGQRAVVCLLAIDPEQRSKEVANACLLENGLTP